MNWFTIVAGGLYIGAALHESMKGNYPMAGAYLAYAAANFCLARA